MNLVRRIHLKERQAEQAQLALEESIAEFRRVLKARLASRAAMTLGFAAGWLIGFVPRRRRVPAKPQPIARAKRGMPKNWLRSYFVWPFLLATARDFLVARRPSRREA